MEFDDNLSLLVEPGCRLAPEEIPINKIPNPPPAWLSPVFGGQANNLQFKNINKQNAEVTLDIFLNFVFGIYLGFVFCFLEFVLYG